MPRHPLRERRVAVLVALLACSLVFTAILAYQAQDAARSHRKTAERTLRDYAAFAALQFSIHAKEGIYSRATALLFGPPKKRQASVACTSPWVDPDTVRFRFRLDLRTRALADTSGCAPAPVVAWLRDTVGAHAVTSFERKWDHADIVGAPDGRRWLVAYSVWYHDDGHPASAFGFAVPFHGFARPVFKMVLRNYPLLPPTLVGQTPNDSLLSLVVDDGHGTTLFRSAARYASPFTAHVSTPKFGGLGIDIALRESVADRLVIGGLPRSRLPLLLGLLLLTAGMVVVAIHQLRREYELARLRADFISSISHELRTPLAQVRMFAETLLLGRVRSDGERLRSLQIIDQEARRLTHLVDNVLQFSRSERHVARIAPEPTPLARQVREAVETFAPLATARRVTVEADASEDLTAVVDPAALRQALLNLLDNAVKYGPSGGTVRVGLHRAGERVRLVVDDQGPGIPERDRDRVWLPFHRLDRDANSATAGSGIGLAVVRDLVLMHGGRAWVEDAPGGGARFVLELPGYRAADSRRDDAIAPVPEAAPDFTPARR